MATTAKEWLNGDRNYPAGLEILKAAGVSAFIVGLLESGPDAFNTPKLLAEIKKLSAQASSRPVVVSPRPSPREREVAATPEPYQPDNNLEKKMRIDQLIRELWKEICHLHGQLSVLPEGERLYEVANLLLVKNLKRQGLWDELNYFKANGHWFDELPENQPKPEDLEKSIKNAMANRAKAKSYLKVPQTAAKKQYYEAKVSEWTRKIDALKSQRDAA